MESEEDPIPALNSNNSRNILSPNTKNDKKKTLSPIAPTDQKQLDISDDDIIEQPRPEPSHLAFNSSAYRQPLSQHSSQNQGLFFNTQGQSQQEHKMQQLTRKDETNGWNTSRNGNGFGRENNNKENFDSKTLGVFSKERSRKQDSKEFKTLSNTAGVRDSVGSNSNRQRTSAYSIQRRKGSDRTIDQSNLPYLEPLPQIMKYPKEDKKKSGSRRNSQDLGDKIKGVIDIYGFELGRKDSRNIIVPKSNSARSSRSQESKRSRDPEDNQLPRLKDDDNTNHNDAMGNSEAHQNHMLKNQHRSNDSSLSQRSRASVLSIGESMISQKMHQNESQGELTANNQHRKLYPHQAASVVAKHRPPLSRTLLTKDCSSSNYLNSCRANSIRQQSIDTPDLSTVTINNATPTSQGTNGQTIQFEQDKGQEFILIRSNNAEAIQIEIANSDRQDDRSGIAGEDFDFEAHFQNLRYPDNTFSSFDHSHFAQQKD